MVLYRILGVTEIIRGSTISGIVAVVSESGRCNIARSMFEAASVCILVNRWVTRLEVEPSKWVGSSDQRP
jgi:hypothetical protein